MAKSAIIPKPITEYDLRLLRIFKTVVENGGFAAAENDLGVTRSTISVHMGNLESRMKLKLCMRGRGGFALTEAGQVVYHACVDLFDSLHDFSFLVRSLGSEMSGELVILCADQLDDVKQQKLARVISYIHQQAPKLHLVLDGDSIHNIEKALLKDKAHIGLFPNYKQVEGLSYQQVFNEPMYLCCGRMHPLFAMQDSDIDEKCLAQQQAIHPGLDIDMDGRQQLKKLNLSARAYQFDMRKTLILSGAYIGFLPLNYVQSEIDKGEIRLMSPDSFCYQFGLSLVSKSMPRENAKVELIKQAFAFAAEKTQ
jgi:DNA-binding transcriptional LysR family regulator